MKITIKIGSNVLTCSNGTLDIPRMESLVAEIAKLHAAGHEIILVSSGAVAAGRSMMGKCEKMDEVSRRQLLSSIGQVKLIDQYKRIFDRHNIAIGQMLVTKQDFSTREHYLNMRNCIAALWDNNVIPVVNENDTVSVTALMFTDNDELSGLLASMMDCDKLFILSNIDGIFNGVPTDPDSSVIREIKVGEDVSQFVHTSKSNFGRGGMQTKCRTAQKTAASGIDVFIANGTKPNVITLLAESDPDFVCTHFVAGEHSPAIKKWIAYSDGFVKATITINAGAAQAITGATAASLLVPGVTAIDGDFKKGDLLMVHNEQGNPIAIGRAAIDKDKIEKKPTSKHTKPLIHYDYLYII